MPSLNKRLAEFNTKMPPPAEMFVELLCRDKNGTYTIPYTCCWFDEEWRNFETDETVMASIVGWRPIEERRKFRSLKKWRRH
jgi:hypothetical protein